MAGLEALKMLSAKGIQVDAIPGGLSPDTVTASMIAASLGYGNLTDQASLYCRIKYQFEDRLRSRLENKVLIGSVLPWAVNENWICGTGTIPKLSKVALDEMLSENICRPCKGTGAIMREDKGIDCATCNGTGHKRYSKREIARRLGVDKNQYLNVWSERYNRTLGLYYDMEQEIISALSRL